MADFRTSSEKIIANMNKVIKRFLIFFESRKKKLFQLSMQILSLTILISIQPSLNSSLSYKMTLLLKIRLWMPWLNKRRKPRL